MSSDVVSRWQVEADRLTEHIQDDDRRFAALDKRLERIETDVRALLEWRWKLVGALMVVVFVASIVANRL